MHAQKNHVEGNKGSRVPKTTLYRVPVVHDKQTYIQIARYNKGLTSLTPIKCTETDVVNFFTWCNYS